MGEKQTERYWAAVHYCKNIRLRVKTGEWNQLITTSEQFTTAKAIVSDKVKYRGAQS